MFIDLFEHVECLNVDLAWSELDHTTVNNILPEWTIVEVQNVLLPVGLQNFPVFVLDFYLGVVLASW